MHVLKNCRHISAQSQSTLEHALMLESEKMLRTMRLSCKYGIFSTPDLKVVWGSIGRLKRTLTFVP